jgi:hypothetical protein
MSFTVPLHTKKPEEGTITYLINPELLPRIQGFFSFTFYIRDTLLGEHTPKGSELYLMGLLAYAKILKDMFKDWKLLVYTDQFTLNELESIKPMKETDFKQGWNGRRDIWNLLKRLNEHKDSIVFAIVDWPSHQRRTTRPQVEGSALRPFRSRAPFDFPDKLIFIRDADTLFESSLNHVRLYREESLVNFVNTLYIWESTFLNQIPDIQEKATKGKPALIAGTGSADSGLFVTKTPYLREWHTNELLNKHAPFGVFAGFVNATPNIPLYSSKEPWDEFVDYVNERSRRINNKPMRGILKQFNSLRENTIDAFVEEKLKYIREKNPAILEKAQEYWNAVRSNIYYEFSNNSKIQRIGRDEQLYLFILFPKALENLVFFEVNLDDTDPPKFNEAFHISHLAEFIAAVSTGFAKKPEPVKENENENAGWGVNMNLQKSLWKKAGEGGKHRKRKTLRMKIEKRKTRKHR